MNKRSQKIILTMVTAMVFVSGCKTLDAYTREEKTSNATKGAMIGAGIGAVVGLISGDDAVERRQHALIGAGIGALAGGAVGAYQDKQEAALRAELEGTGVSVTRIGDNITLNMPGNVTFATNSSDLSPAFFDVLNSVGKVLQEFDLSNYLRGQGVLTERLLTVGMGELRPVADNSTGGGRQANRRVEITMVPLTAG
jgi:outer membrane protein OmpA-like peptidoglycan-associated protein